MDLHGADRTEFLTAEAVDAGLAVDLRFSIFHCDGFGWADIRALFAADAVPRAKPWVRRKHMEQEAVGEPGHRPLAAAAEKDARLRGDGLVVRDRKRGGIAEKLQPFRAVRGRKTESYAIGAQGIDAINEAYPVPPLENVDANFQAMAAATPDFTAVCDGQPAACCANISLYNANSQSFSDVESLPPQGSAYIVLMLMVPKDWKQLKVTYVPTFLEGKSLTFVMNASDVIRS